MIVGVTFLIVTMNLFVKTHPLDEDMFLYWRRSNSSHCEPFTTHMIDCNKCVCSADGTSYCTRMKCSGDPIVIKQEKMRNLSTFQQDDSSIDE